MSCHITNQLSDFTFKEVIHYPSYESAYESVIENENWGLLHFDEGFSAAISQRIIDILRRSPIDETVFNASQIKLQVDSTNVEVARTLTLDVFNSIERELFNV